MSLRSFFHVRKQAKELAELTRSGIQLARAGRMSEARHKYVLARKYRQTVYTELSGHFGRETAHKWDRKAAHMMTPLATMVSAWDV